MSGTNTLTYAVPEQKSPSVIGMSRRFPSVGQIVPGKQSCSSSHGNNLRRLRTERAVIEIPILGLNFET